MDAQMIFSVTELNGYVAALLSADPHLKEVMVRGEISGFKRHSSGHFYFSLKDEGALVDCVMFRSYAQQMDFRPEDGQQVVVSGTATIYAKSGRFQLYVTSMERSGEGALYRKFIELKNRLEKEGLFDSEKKKPIPFLPETVGIVTSGTGAAIQDIMQIIGRRFPKMNLLLCPVKVQGDGAALEIAAGVREINRNKAADVIIVGRGGGSMEDLWAFNEPEVAYAIFESEIPVISAVGHETDFTIADFVADLRAPTPSAAAELAVPEYDVLTALLRDYAERLSGVLERDLERRRSRLDLMYRSPGFVNIRLRIGDERQNLDGLAERMERAVSDRTERERHRLEKFLAGLSALSPDSVMERGYSIVRDANGNLIKSRAGLHVDDRVRIRFSDGTAGAVVTDLSEK